jgi:quercetin dioxygenase-like cupin family protein
LRNDEEQLNSMTDNTSAWVVMAEGVRRRILSDGEKLMLVEVHGDAGAVVKRHSHPHEQASFIARGRAVFTIGEQTIEAAQGDVIPIPSHIPHSVVFVEDCIVIDTFSPPREDFRMTAR